MDTTLIQTRWVNLKQNPKFSNMRVGNMRLDTLLSIIVFIVMICKLDAGELDENNPDHIAQLMNHITKLEEVFLIEEIPYIEPKKIIPIKKERIVRRMNRRIKLRQQHMNNFIIQSRKNNIKTANLIKELEDKFMD